MAAVAGLLALGVFPPMRASVAQDAVQQEVPPNPREVVASEPLVDEAFFDEVRERLAEASNFNSYWDISPTPSVGSAPATSNSTRYIRRRRAA